MKHAISPEKYLDPLHINITEKYKAHYGNMPAHVVRFTVSRNPGSATSG